MGVYQRIICLSLAGTLGLALGVSRPVLADQALATAPATVSPVVSEYRLDGTVEAVHRSTLSAQTSGQVQAVLVDVDDYVEQGKVIIRLKDAEQRARLEQAEANLQAATAGLQDAGKEFERIRGVWEKKLVAKSAFDKASAGLKTARAQHKAAEAALAQAREQLDYTQVRAPFTGIVTERHIEPGETAQPGRPLISGLSLDRLRVNVDLPQGMIGAVRAHQQARVRLPDGNWLDATGLTVFPYADPATNTFKVRVELPAGAKGVFPGMFLKVAFVIGSGESLTVPLAAVVHRSEVTAVYVVGEDGRIGLRHVRLGRLLGDRQVVLAGLHAGEQVALDPVAAGVSLKRQRGE